jgi:IclR family pca regulon transcriptional regulator
LAFLSAEKLDAYVAASRGRTHYFRDKRSAEDVFPILKKIRERGYIIGDSTLTEGLRILAVPVLRSEGDPIGAISVTTPTVREVADQMEGAALELAKAAAKEISVGIQASGSVELVI